MKRVLIITYYWPPAGGIGVQRWLQFSKNLRDQGWEPVIYTAKDASYPIFDENLEAQIPFGIEVHKVRVPEPNNFFSIFQLGNKKSKKLYELSQQSKVDTSPIKKLLWTIRGNFFIPDARMFWISKSFKYLSKYLENNPVDAVISSGPPHSTHMIARRLKKRFNLLWFADFRDPWTSMDYLKKMNLKPRAEKKHARLEKAVVTEADKVVVVGKTIANEFKENHGVDCELIFNGYNPSIEEKSEVQLDFKFTIVHTGGLTHYRNCPDLWKVLGEMTRESEEFAAKLEIKLVGFAASNVYEAIEKAGLNPYLNKVPRVDHEESKRIQRSAQMLLLPIDRIENAEFVLTGKLFEYLQAKRPILLIGPSNGDAADIVLKTKAGDVIDFEDITKLKETLHSRFQLYLQNENNCLSEGIEQFSYPNLTKQLVGLLNNTEPK